MLVWEKYSYIIMFDRTGWYIYNGVFTFSFCCQRAFKIWLLIFDYNIIKAIIILFWRQQIRLDDLITMGYVNAVKLRIPKEWLVEY